MTKRNRDRIKNSGEETIEVVQFIKVLLIVIILLAGVYLFTRIFVTKDLFNKNDDTNESESGEEVDINYDYINLGTIFNRPYNEYYVVIYDSEESEDGYYLSTGTNYKSSDDAIKIYFADLASPFNSSYESDESNSNATNATELKIKRGTLIKIKNGKITKYLEGKDAITKELEVKK